MEVKLTKIKTYYRLAKLMFDHGNRTSGNDMLRKAWALPAWDANMVLSEDGTRWEAADVT